MHYGVAATSEEDTPSVDSRPGERPRRILAVAGRSLFLVAAVTLALGAVPAVALRGLRKAHGHSLSESDTGALLETAEHQPTVQRRGPAASDGGQGPSLFCWALMMSDTYEVLLLRMQFEKGVGLFSCDGYSVFSDVALRLGGSGSPVLADVVEGPLLVPRNPQYNFALNTRVFLRVWAKIFAQGDFGHFDWTVKVDPDTVFIVSRLREHLRRGPPPQTNVTFVNCRFGNHGPIEILSRPAVEAFREGLGRCREERAAGLDEEGEDMYLQACLELLGVRQVKDFGLLSEEACQEDPFPCTSGRVAFHPMKPVDKWMQCLAQAEG